MSLETSWITETPPMTISVLPPTSRFAPIVRAAAATAGVTFVPWSAQTPVGALARLLVVEVVGAAPTELGPLTIAVSPREDIDCFDVLRPDEAPRRLPRAIKALVRHAAMQVRVTTDRRTIQILNEIGHALSAVRDRDSLLSTVLTCTRRALRAARGVLYLRTGDTLRFTAQQADAGLPETAPSDVLLSDDTLVANAARGGVAVLMRATPVLPREFYAHPSDPVAAAGMAAPLVDRTGTVIGVLALYGHKPYDEPLTHLGEARPFAARHLDLLGSVASQIAVSLENHRMYEEIKGLFDGFVRASVSAIEARDPSTGGHSQRVAELTTRLAREASASDDVAFRAVHFSEQQITELHYASLLHDFGKVGVREHILLKAGKLFPAELETVELRFRIATLEAILDGVHREEGEAETQGRLGRLKDDLALVRRLHAGAAVGDVERAMLDQVVARWQIVDASGARAPALPPRCVDRLCIPFGTLDAAERREIESHVDTTYRFLRLIPWTDGLRNVPEIAWTHHEKLDGTGYPRGVSVEQIPWGARLMAVTDIWDALTAKDRPYKPAVGHERALTILRAEAASGKIAAEAVELFAGRRLWQGIPTLG